MIRWIFLVFSILSVQLVNAEKITFANGEWAPYLSEKLKHHGYISHIVTDAYAAEGYTLDYVFLPWKRSFEEAKVGKYQGTLIWGYNEERAKDFLYSDSVAELGTGLFYLKDKPFDWKKPEDLKGLRIGGVIGYSYGLEEYEKSGLITINRVGKDEANYKKLLGGRLDIVLEDTEVGYELVTRLGMKDKVALHPKLVKQRPYSVIIPKKLPNAQQLINAFNSGLKKVKADGRYDQYVEASRRGEYKQ